MGQRHAISVNTLGGKRLVYYDPETDKIYSNSTGVGQPGDIVQQQALDAVPANIRVKKGSDVYSTQDFYNDFKVGAKFWNNYLLSPRYGENPNTTIRRKIDGDKEVVYNPQTKQIIEAPSNLSEAGQQNLNTLVGSLNGVDTKSVQPTTQPTGQMQMVKGPDGRWTYKMIGQVPEAQIKATMKQIREMNARLDEQAAAQQQAPSANRWTNLRDTSAIQRFLTMQGYNLEIDGKMGRQTQAALRDWQSKNGLKADGLWGNNTEAAAKRAESTMMAPIQAPQSSGVTIESRTTPTYAGTTTSVPNLALSYTIGQDMANGAGMFANGKLFGNQPLSPREEAAQYQKRGGCMYKRGKRIK